VQLFEPKVEEFTEFFRTPSEHAINVRICSEQDIGAIKGMKSKAPERQGKAGLSNDVPKFRAEDRT